MKLVEGRTLKELFASKPTLRDRLALLSHVIAIADAVGYAHSEGVIAGVRDGRIRVYELATGKM